MKRGIQTGRMSGRASHSAQFEVLLVDDDAAFLRSLKSVLRPAPVSVLCANSGEQALELVETRRPHLLVVDYDLGPGMNGLALLQKAKQLHPPVRGFLLTASPQVRAPWGVDIPVLTKPCSPETLLELVMSLAKKPG